MTQTELSLAERIARLEDLAEIRRLTASYKKCLDGKDTAGYAALFAENGTLWCTPELQATGRAAIKTLVDSMGGELLTEVVGTDCHLMANHLIELDGDRATGSQTWVYLIAAENGNPEVNKVGHYADQYVRENGQWRFVRREAPMDIPLP